MPPATRRAALLVVLLAPLAAAPACGDDEPAQRRAFLAFLQSRILDRPGLRVPRPTPDEAKAWGGYAQHYAVITGFNDALNARVSGPMTQAVQRGAFRSVQDLLDRRGDIADVRRGVAELGTELDRQLAAAEAARAALRQPDDLKPVFDAAFERTVAAPARGFREAVPATDRALAAALDFADFLARNPRGVRVEGPSVQVLDPALQREVAARLEAMNALSREVQAVQARLRALVAGG